MIVPSRFYRAATLVVAVILLTAVVLIAEFGQNGQMTLNARIRIAQEREVVLAELLGLLTDAEADQRGYLLTGEDRFLQRYQEARDRVEPRLNGLSDLFRQDDQMITAEQRDSSRHLRVLVGARLGELAASTSLHSTPDPQQAVALARTDIANTTMAELRSETMKLRNAERSAVSDALESADQLRVVSRSLMVAAAIINIILLIIAGGLLARQARRRAELTEQLVVENEELERRVHQRTVELSTLSSHLQNLSEKEKAALARELHDELGGLLISVKMDIAWLQKRYPEADQDMQLRFNRVLKGLDDGVDFKRRLVENLRPTLLDNMGLFPAVRWITQETCSRAGLRYTEEYPEQEPLLTDDAAITIFRLVQESLVNIVKHANATDVSVLVQLTDGNLIVCVEDDGQGIDAARLTATGSHGLATMRHRVRRFSGQLDIE